MERGSYLLLEPGMRIRDRSGDDLGSITEVVADEYADIFRGIVIEARPLNEPVFVSGENVIRVDDDVATIDLDLEHLARGDYRNGGLRSAL